MIFAHWKYFIAAFAVALVILSAAVVIEECWQARQRRRDKEKRK